LSKRELAKLFVKDFLGLTLIGNIKGKNVQVPETQFRRKHPTPGWFKAVYFVTVALILTLTHAWFYFLIYWIVPLVTVLQVIVRWGALCEHVYGTERALVEDSSPTIVLAWWERVLLPNLNFTLHPYHHYFPAVSFANLPKLHAIFRSEDLVRKDLLFNGYVAFLRYVWRVKSEPLQCNGSQLQKHDNPTL
jgi:fatty acid desaturase